MTKNKYEQIVVEALEDIKGMDIRVLDVSAMTDVVDTMVVATGGSSRQVKALADNVVEQVKKAGYPPLSTEGQDSGDWVLIDLGDISVHVMTAEARAFYDLERLWSRSRSSSSSVAPEPA